MSDALSISDRDVLLYNEPMSTRAAPSHSRSFLWSIVLFLSGGALFGTLARLIIEAAPAAPDAGSPLWLVNHLTSGTWLWAVVACASTWIGMRHSRRSGWRRYMESFLLCLGFLAGTTIAWYGPLTPGTQLPLLTLTALALCAIPAAGIAVVGAFGRITGLLGLLARLCVPLGLALVLLVAPPPPLEYGGAAAAELLVWRVLMGANVGLAVFFLSHFLLSKHRGNSISSPLH